MAIKEIRRKTGLTQKDFAMKYHIPVQTLKQWESDPHSSSYRKPPEYVELLIEAVSTEEIQKNSLIRAGYFSFLLKGAEDSRCHAKQWYRYLRKVFRGDTCILNDAEIAALKESSALSMFQKVSFSQALDPDTVTHQYIVSLNRRTETPMMNQLLGGMNHGSE